MAATAQASEIDDERAQRQLFQLRQDRRESALRSAPLWLAGLIDMIEDNVQRAYEHKDGKRYIVLDLDQAVNLVHGAHKILEGLR